MHARCAGETRCSVLTAGQRLFGRVFGDSNILQDWPGSWSHLVPLVVQNGPTVLALTRPSATFHDLSSQVSGTVTIFDLHLCKGLFPPEKRPSQGAAGPVGRSA